VGYHPTPVLFEQGGHHLLIILQGFHRCCLAFSHQPAISGYIGTEDSSEFPFKILCVHEITSPWADAQKEKATKWVQDSLGSFISKTFGWRFSMVVSGRLGFC